MSRKSRCDSQSFYAHSIEHSLCISNLSTQLTQQGSFTFVVNWVSLPHSFSSETAWNEGKKSMNTRQRHSNVIFSAVERKSPRPLAYQRIRYSSHKKGTFFFKKRPEKIELNKVLSLSICTFFTLFEFFSSRDRRLKLYQQLCPEESWDSRLFP
jgi:hypothetical protein